jgi:hypothetical protein
MKEPDMIAPEYQGNGDYSPFFSHGGEREIKGSDFPEAPPVKPVFSTTNGR